MTGQYLNQHEVIADDENFAWEMSKNFFIESKMIICIDTDENSPFSKYAFSIQLDNHTHVKIKPRITFFGQAQGPVSAS